MSPILREKGIISLQSVVQHVTYVEEFFGHRGVQIPGGTFLHRILQEARSLGSGNKVPRQATPAKTDELAAISSYPALAVFRIAEALNILAQRRTRLLTPRLIDLAKKKDTSIQQAEFIECEYELFCASQFAEQDFRVAFVRTGVGSRRHRSRYRKRVEFLVKNRIPVECKAPRGKNGFTRQVRAAAVKIDERAVPGLAAIALDRVLDLGDRPISVSNCAELDSLLAAKLKKLWETSYADAKPAFANGWLKGIIVNYTGLAYYSDEDTVGLPGARYLLTPDCSVIADEVIPAALDLVQ